MKKTFCLLTAALLSVSACSVERVSNFPSYKLKVVQGNELDAQAITQLQAGLSKEQVQMLLGTPLLQDPFHRERWDYVFVTTRNGLVQENTALTLYFNAEGQLIKAEGDALQKAREQLTAQAAAATQAAAASAAQ
ncbi:outer membrane protein assembly factor BamE [Snodgrassella sp. CFCC 13594]|uniref:outer membrane protein assembly factor BamE n=1 Tax=Snodgrassella sp. CFCC 13594 TaxID=1775559 RepID=UPI00083426FC|nr:outer membrane protein assembly factor BamE [Snodgrassella sp. CFCC 13594]